jgi:ribonuclease P protein component
MFPREWRLTRQRDVQKVYRLGKSAASGFLFIRALPNRVNHPRLTVVISKKINKRAVVRNRLKRLTRQALQELLQDPAAQAKLATMDAIITIHRDPEEPYTLERLKKEVTQCVARLP